MSANLGVLVQRPLLVLALVAALVVAKAAVLRGLGRWAGLPRESRLGLVVALSQGGEFAFFIFASARGARVLDAELAELLVMVVTVSMMTTPLVFLLRDWLVARLERDEARAFDAVPDEHSQVVIAGFGRVGEIVGRVPRMKRIPFTALDNSATHVDFVRRFGNRIFYGDASRLDLVRAAHLEHTRVFVLCIDHMEASMRTLGVVQRHFPHLTVVARARNRQHAYALHGADVEHVVRETFSGSCYLARLVVVQAGLAASEARTAVQTFARYDEAALRDAVLLRHDEAALVESAKKYAAELERIFEADARSR